MKIYLDITFIVRYSSCFKAILSQNLKMVKFSAKINLFYLFALYCAQSRKAFRLYRATNIRRLQRRHFADNLELFIKPFLQLILPRIISSFRYKTYKTHR